MSKSKRILGTSLILGAWLSVGAVPASAADGAGGDIEALPSGLLPALQSALGRDASVAHDRAEDLFTSAELRELNADDEEWDDLEEDEAWGNEDEAANG